MEDMFGTPTAAGSVTANATSGPGNIPATGCISRPSGGVIRFKNLGCGCELTAPLGTSTTINVTTQCAIQGCNPVYCTSTPTTTQIVVVMSGLPLTCTEEYNITIQ